MESKLESYYYLEYWERKLNEFDTVLAHLLGVDYKKSANKIKAKIKFYKDQINEESN